jgi:tetratricopeptide (TPR) repeat protein
LAFALVTVGLAYTFQRDVDRAKLVATEVLALSQAFKLPQWIAFAKEIQGWVLCQCGEPHAGIVLIEQALGRLHATGGRSHSTRMLANLTEGYLASGDADAANRHLDAAFAYRSEQREHYYAAELYRLRAAILAKAGAATETIEASFDGALTTAQSQGAGLFADRAARMRTAISRTGTLGK